MSINTIMDKGDLTILKVIISADATGGKVVPIPHAFELVDVVVQCYQANLNGSMTLKKGATAITNAIGCGTDKEIVRAGTIDDDYSTLHPTDTIAVYANGANDRGVVWLLGYRT